MPTPTQTASLCPCGNQQDYSRCCQPFHQGIACAPSAEALMRSRYSAYVRGNIEYLLSTRHPSTRHLDNPTSLQHSIEHTQWLNLTVTHCTQGTPNDTTGTVTFTAHYLEHGNRGILTETSQFVRENAQWYYVDGDYSAEPPAPPLGRNAPCWCGSGKKFKRCHG